MRVLARPIKVRLLAAILALMLCLSAFCESAAAKVYVSSGSGSIFPSDLFMPAQGSVTALVLPVQFLDTMFDEDPASFLTELFSGSGTENVPSVSDYFTAASYGSLSLSFAVSPVVTLSGGRERYEDDPQKLIDEALSAAVSAGLDLSRFDSGGDGTLDGLYLIWPGQARYNSSWWPSSDTFYQEFDSCGYRIGSYTSLSYDMLRSGTAMRQYTAIHETGHQFGLTDYYAGGSTAGTGADIMMDRNIGDEDPFSKLLLGWNQPFTVSEDGWYRLDSSSVSPDVMVLAAPDWDGNLLSEYFLVEYVTPEGNNASISVPEGGALRVWHVNAETSRYTNEITVDMYKYSNKPESDEKLLTMAVSGTQWFLPGETADLSGLLYEDSGLSWSLTVGKVKDGTLSVWVSPQGDLADLSSDPNAGPGETSSSSSDTSSSEDTSSTDQEEESAGSSEQSSSGEDASSQEVSSEGSSGESQTDLSAPEISSSPGGAQEPSGASPGAESSEGLEITGGTVASIVIVAVICIFLLIPRSSGRSRSASRSRPRKRTGSRSRSGTQNRSRSGTQNRSRSGTQSGSRQRTSSRSRTSGKSTRSKRDSRDHARRS